MALLIAEWSEDQHQPGYSLMKMRFGSLIKHQLKQHVQSEFNIAEQITSIKRDFFKLLFNRNS